MTNRLDDLCINCSFRLDGMTHTILDFVNGRVKCEREDGVILFLAGHLKADTWERRRSFGQWFRQAIP